MPNPVFDPTLPVDNSLIVAAELRDQFNALDARIPALEQAIQGRAGKPTVGEFDPGFSDPPTLADLMAIQSYINGLVQQLES
jgi:hypothetical protein